MFLANNGASANAPSGGGDLVRNNQPGKIEDLPSPTGDFGQQQYDHNTSNTSSGYGEGPVSPLTPAGSQGQSAATRTVISEMRRQFLNGGAAESNPAAALPPRQPPKTNKYL